MDAKKKELRERYEKYIDSQSRCMGSYWTKKNPKPKGTKKGGKSSGKK